MANKPKRKCCVSKPRCKRCPLRMLADGTLPSGYTVKKRKLVKLDAGLKGDGDASGKGAKKSKDKKDKKKQKKKERKRAEVAAELATLPKAS